MTAIEGQRSQAAKSLEGIRAFTEGVPLDKVEISAVADARCRLWPHIATFAFEMCTNGWTTANLRTKIPDFRGFDSNIILKLRGGILMSMGNLLELLSQQIFIWKVLVGRLGALPVACALILFAAFSDALLPSDSLAHCRSCPVLSHAMRLCRGSVVPREEDHYPKYDDDLCSKLFLSQEQKHFRSRCPQGLMVIFSVKTARNLATTPKGRNFGRNFESACLYGYGKTLGSQLITVIAKFCLTP